ncbi:MAG: acetyl-CoA carboxylase biotin carboxyl carrier protein [Candidatus Aureabacteria bacterium]|nr:acetyl-CoA carboxylase biotin carboxyl carrier protein [Candidatus Auribacterota bacterium]
MNIKEIEKIIELMNDNAIVEFTLEKEGEKLSLKKAGGVMIPQEVSMYPAYSGMAQAGSPKAEAIDSQDEVGIEYISSPIVGTFYSSPSPESDVYVKEGDKVETGKVVCIIEAMKVMNEIKSDITGTIVEILVENGAPVEFGQKIFKIKKK